MTEALGHAIHCIDTAYQRTGLAACYLVQDRGEAALIETGTPLSAPRVLAALAGAGVAPAAVRYLIPTHVHLDHAGGAGTLARALPDATVLVHPRGERHLADPARLIEGATAVYGAQRFARLYGEVLPVPSERLRAVADGSVVELGGRRLLIRDTPGHARHHFCVWDETSGGWFTGDTFGVAYRELAGAAGPFPLPTTTPVQFEPEALLDSIGLLMAARPRRMYLTHYGGIAASETLAAELRTQIEDYVRMAQAITAEEPGAASRLATALADYTVARLRAAGCRWREAALRRFIALDMDLNADGLISWRLR